MATKQVAKKEAQMPAYINQDGNRGSENVSSEDMQLPRISVLQDLSPQTKKNKGEYIEGAEPGFVFNNLTGELYTDGMLFIPVFFQKQYLVWKDRKSGGGLAGVFDNLQDAEREAATDETYEVNPTPTHIVVILNEDGSVAGEATIPMPSSKLKVSRKFNSLVRMNGGDRFSRTYRLSAVEDESPSGEYWNFRIDNEGWPTEEAYRHAENLYMQIAEGDVKVSTDYSDESSEEDDF